MARLYVFFACVVETRHGTSLHVSTWRIKFIIYPIRHIVFDVIHNAVHFWRVADDVVVETGLPGKIEGVFVGIMGYRSFQTSYDYR